MGSRTRVVKIVQKMSSSWLNISHPSLKAKIFDRTYSKHLVYKSNHLLTHKYDVQNTFFVILSQSSTTNVNSLEKTYLTVVVLRCLSFFSICTPFMYIHGWEQTIFYILISACGNGPFEHPRLKRGLKQYSYLNNPYNILIY